MGVLGGIIAGIIVYKLHNRFYTVQLPDSFAFFSGARFVPIITSLVLGFVGLIILDLAFIRYGHYGYRPANPTFRNIWSLLIRFRGTTASSIRASPYSSFDDTLY